MLEGGVLIKYRCTDDSAQVSWGRDLDPETRDPVVPVLDLALIKPEQECCLVLGLGIALLLHSSIMSMLKTADYFTLIHYGFKKDPNNSDS